MYDLLFLAFDLVEKIGWPIAVAAWVTVFGGSLALLLPIRRVNWRPHWKAALVVFLVSELAHVSDIVVTFIVSPDLEIEANPIWLIVIDRWGLTFALWYGLTGKLLVGVLNAELYLWYRATRASLFPAEARSLGEFARRLGENAPKRFGVAWGRVFSLFAWIFGLFGVYSFYVAFLNYVGGFHLEYYESFPSPVTAIGFYLAVLSVLYFVAGWRAFRRAQPAFAQSAS